MKGISYCGECSDYSYKKHCCKRGAKLESDPMGKFYDDCPLTDVIVSRSTLVDVRLQCKDTPGREENMMINNYGCTLDDGKTCNAGPGPDREPIAAMLGMANDLTAKAMDMTLHISSQVLGSPMPDMNTKDPMCMRDAVEKHVGDLRTLCEELVSISKGLGV